MKRWLVVGAIVGALALALTGGAVLAQDNGTTEDESTQQTRGQRFADRVAEILGLESQQVQDAMRQAAREMRDERVQQRLDRLVENGRLTQEQADEYLEWYQARPEVVGTLMGLHGHGKFKMHRMHGPWRFGGGHPMAPPAPEAGDGTEF